MAPTLQDYREAACRRWEGDSTPPLGGTRPHVSLITICFNAVKSISRTIESVQAQNFPSLEHIFVDGGSVDGTLEVIRASLRPSDYLLTESDRGISDALNKGVALAAGEYIQFIHADDWLSPGQVACAVETLEKSGADFVFGNLTFYEGGRPQFVLLGEGDYAKRIHRRMPNLNHVTVLARRTCFEHIGLFDLRYRCAMDYDWFLRLHRAGGHGVYEPRLCGHMNHDGVSNTRFDRTMAEVCTISIENGYNPVLAHVEKHFQTTKIKIGRMVKERALPLYRLVRKTINPAFRPLQ